MELAGSALCGAFLDSGDPTVVPGPDALINNSLNSDILGQYIFNVRSGAVVVRSNGVPEPGTLALMAIAVLGFGLTRRRRT